MKIGDPSFELARLPPEVFDLLITLLINARAIGFLTDRGKLLFRAAQGRSNGRDQLAFDGGNLSDQVLRFGLLGDHYRGKVRAIAVFVLLNQHVERSTVFPLVEHLATHRIGPPPVIEEHFGNDGSR